MIARRGGQKNCFVNNDELKLLIATYSFLKIVLYRGYFLWAFSENFHTTRFVEHLWGIASVTFTDVAHICPTGLTKLFINQIFIA